MLQHHRSQPPHQAAPRSPLDGLWVLLVDNAGQLATADERVPMLARAGDDQTYLLGFKNATKARQFVATQDVVAEPRMIVRGNKDDILRIAKVANVVGVLVDYDPSTQRYGAAVELA